MTYFPKTKLICLLHNCFRDIRCKLCQVSFMIPRWETCGKNNISISFKFHQILHLLCCVLFSHVFLLSQFCFSKSYHLISGLNKAKGNLPVCFIFFTRYRWSFDGLVEKACQPLSLSLSLGPFSIIGSCKMHCCQWCGQ